MIDLNRFYDAALEITGNVPEIALQVGAGDEMDYKTLSFGNSVAL